MLAQDGIAPELRQSKAKKEMEGKFVMWFWSVIKTIMTDWKEKSMATKVEKNGDEGAKA